MHSDLRKFRNFNFCESAPVHLSKTAKQELAKLEGRAFFEAFEIHVWLAVEAQAAIAEAQVEDLSFPKTVRDLVELWPKGRWPLSIEVEQAVYAFTKSIPPKEPKFRQKRVGHGTGWMGADVMANVKVSNGSPGRAAKPKISKRTYTLLFSRYNLLMEALREKELLASGRPTAGNRERIASVDWNPSYNTYRVDVKRSALISPKSKTARIVYEAIEFETLAATKTKVRPGRKEKYPWKQAVSSMEQKLEDGAIVNSLADLARLLVDCIIETGSKDFPENKSAERYLRDKQKELVQRVFGDDRA